MALFRKRRQEVEPEVKPPLDIPPIVEISGGREWTGPPTLNPRTLTWERRYVHRHFQTGLLTDIILVDQGEMYRPGPLRDVIELDVPHALLLSHPNTPGALPEDLEGMWVDTNPAWPEMSLNVYLGQFGCIAALAESAEAAVTEDFMGYKAELVFVKPYNADVPQPQLQRSLP